MGASTIKPLVLVRFMLSILPAETTTLGIVFYECPIYIIGMTISSYYSDYTYNYHSEYGFTTINVPIISSSVSGHTSGLVSDSIGLLCR